MQIRILPSLLAADVGNLEAAARRADASGADALHIDIMDGHFVPNISFGPAIVAMAKRCVTIPLSVHLMVSRPDQYITRFVEAGADSLLIHIEAECDIPEVLNRISELGARPGITLNPETPAEMVYSVMDKVEEVLCMTVHPGYGGQGFMNEIVPKMKQVREFADSRGFYHLDLLVDGGIDLNSAVLCAQHGANAFIVGTTLYRLSDMAEGIRQMRQKVEEAFCSQN